MGHKRKTERKIHDSHDCAEDTRIGNAAVSRTTRQKMLSRVLGRMATAAERRKYLFIGSVIRHRDGAMAMGRVCVCAYSKNEDNDYYGRNIFLSFYYIGFFFRTSKTPRPAFWINICVSYKCDRFACVSAILRTGSRDRRDSTPKNMHEHAENATSRKNGDDVTSFAHVEGVRLHCACQWINVSIWKRNLDRVWMSQTIKSEKRINI